MKVTQMETYRTLIHQMESSSGNLNRLYEQAASGKRINRTSDDPSAISPILNSSEQIAKADRYLETIRTTQDSLDILDGYLDGAEEIFVRAKEIAIAGSNDSLSAEDLRTLGDEVAQLQTELLDIANAKVDGKYLFSGYAENTLPFSGDPVVYNGTSDHKQVEISAGQRIRTNLTGEELFMAPVDVFSVLSDLQSALAAGDVSTVATQLDTVEQAAEQIRSQRSEMGNINSYLDDVDALTEEVKLQMKERLSNYEDADLVEVMTDITLAEQSYEAALNVSARLSQLTSLDYL